LAGGFITHHVKKKVLINYEMLDRVLRDLDGFFGKPLETKRKMGVKF
jgi:hypothetical protein